MRGICKTLFQKGFLKNVSKQCCWSAMQCRGPLNNQSMSKARHRKMLEPLLLPRLGLLSRLASRRSNSNSAPRSTASGMREPHFSKACPTGLHSRFRKPLFPTARKRQTLPLPSGCLISSISSHHRPPQKLTTKARTRTRVVLLAKIRQIPGRCPRQMPDPNHAKPTTENHFWTC